MPEPKTKGDIIRGSVTSKTAYTTASVIVGVCGAASVPPYSDLSFQEPLDLGFYVPEMLLFMSNPKTLLGYDMNDWERTPLCPASAGGASVAPTPNTTGVDAPTESI